MVCKLRDCQRHVYVEPGPKGRVHDFCGKSHAKEAGYLKDDQPDVKGTVLRRNGGNPSPEATNDQVSCHLMPLIQLPPFFLISIAGHIMSISLEEELKTIYC